ncbi:ROK family protein [Paracoccus shandongensis]|uniref:ROK family protein n=1 Tax=Paracoccus shandongensis TaxID=2816048 RepID=UPI001A8D76C9|nr:ROK family protein [Paracoccus shandongensis]
MGPISRVELMREMDISSASLTKITTALIGAGRLEESDLRDEGSFGRPRRYLQVAPGRQHVLAATLMPGRLDMALAGPDGDIRFARSIPCDGPAAAAVPRIADLSAQILRDAGLVAGDVSGLCLTLPGHVDLDGRRLLMASRPGWGNGALADLLEAALPWPVTLANKVNAMAFAEAIRTTRGQQQALAYVYLAQGLGAGIVHEARGQPFSGRGALEFGHVRVADPGLPCDCGRSGCLETVLTRAVLEAPDQAFRSGAGAVIAQAFANLLTLTNPEHLVLGGALATLPPARHEALVGAIRDRLMPHRRDATRFRTSVLGGDAALLGAAAVGLDRFHFSGAGL